MHLSLKAMLKDVVALEQSFFDGSLRRGGGFTAWKMYNKLLYSMHVQDLIHVTGLKLSNCFILCFYITYYIYEFLF